MTNLEKYDFQVVREGLYATVNGIRIESDKDLIVRPDTMQPLGIVGKDSYNLITHNELVTSVNNALTDMGLDTEQKTTMTKNGSRLYHIIDFPSETVEPEVGDMVNMRAILRNSYDGSSKVGFELGGVRLVCSNGLKTFRKAFFVLQKHNSLFDMESVTAKFKNAVTMFHMEIAGFFKVLQGTPLDKMAGLAMVKRLLDEKLVPEKYANTIGQIWLNPQESNDIISEVNDESSVTMQNTELDKARNLWSWYNACTLVITHCIKSIERQAFIHDAVQKQLKNKLI